MNKIAIVFILSGCFLFPAHAESKEDAQLQKLRQAIKTIQPLAKPLSEAKPGDWLSVHYESGQSFAQFVDEVKTPLTAQRKKIYIQPVGDFTPAQQKIIAEVTRFLGVFFNLPVETRPKLALTQIPESARRKNPLNGKEQILTRYIMEEKMIPVLPKDTAFYLAFTASDLWTGEEGNFVFGEACGDEPVGIWSIARFGNPDAGPKEYQQCLAHALKIAGHEASHMVGLRHCTWYQCGMNGYNSLEEMDSRPTVFCPECIAKLCWVCRLDMKAHCKATGDFLRSCDLADQASGYDAYLKALGK